MQTKRKVSKSGIELIKRFEGLRREAARLADGRWTFGYGHTKFAKDGVTITEKDAEALLMYDLIEVAGAIEDLTFVPLSQNQFDALTSFTFNVGVDRFKGSAVLRRLNEGETAKAAFAIEAWRRSDFEGEAIVVDALVRRRATEKALFLTPDDGFVPAPSSVLQPELDYQIDSRPPVDAPVELLTPFEGAVAQAYRTADIVVEPAPSPAIAAMETVSDRLRALVPEEPATTVGVPLPSAPAADEPEPIVKQAAIAIIEEETIAPFPVQVATVIEAAEKPESPAPQAAEPQAPGSQAPEPKISAKAELAAKAPAVHKAVADLPRPATKSKSLVWPLAFAIGGVLLFGFAIFWGLNSAGREDAGANGQALSYLAGIVGIIGIFAAAYMILDRFAGDDA